MKLVTRNDVIIIALLIVTILFISIRAPYRSTEAEVYVSGKAYMKIDLSKDATYNIENHMTVEVLAGKIRAKESDCPEKLCVKQGWISSPGVPIVCLPNKIVIEIISTTSGETMDAITR
ncbi:hypothetical protein AT15_01385 [Kosmotoga arenicorallina S304]|uniref:Uncharacterized protein n=1 Tax=Kosmotoga arenicorallina S304 TaxID=1453497 RepID=A0A176JZZ9_9BACT|nr:NusG domain II-containing protein [Kosmotoga arenicorallina]OAA29721.1 hypothetical protein AT15_01385 [Kosmotoga arenicorallina S304]